MTEPAFRLIAPQANRSFVFKWEVFDLTTRWHYHPEVELIYFIEGKTNGVIGEGFQYFEEGDLVILGANFPHVLQENREFVRQSPDCKPFGLIIQFTEDFLGPDFLKKPELKSIELLLKKSHRGLRFRKSSTMQVASKLMAMHELSETRKLISLLDILSTLAEGNAYDYMTPKDYSYDSSHDEERMRNINQYVYAHFTGAISIKEIAGIANMTETSFCRYFKSRTLKHFSRFLNEVRISYACKLLSNSRYSVTEVCFESGFNTLSYFTRQFKKITKLTPQEFQKMKRSSAGTFKAAEAVS
ncbi:AraC family transcriptional regulator [soil metagenome]